MKQFVGPFLVLGIAWCSAPAETVKRASLESGAPAHLKGLSAENTDYAIDVESVKLQTQPREEAAAAEKVLSKVIVESPSFFAVHALTFLSKTGNPKLVESARTRLKNERGQGWAEKHVRLGAMQAVAGITGEKFSQELRPLLADKDPGIQLRALDVVKTSKDASLDDAVRGVEARAEREDLKAAARLALAETMGSGKSAQGATQAVPKSYSPEEEEALKQAVMSREHGRRMAAIEELMINGSEGSKGWLRRLGDLPQWEARMKSAYALIIAGDKREIRARLETEEHPLVQIALLSAMSKPDKE